jgi:hypothetical protein
MNKKHHRTAKRIVALWDQLYLEITRLPSPEAATAMTPGELTNFHWEFRPVDGRKGVYFVAVNEDGEILVDQLMFVLASEWFPATDDTAIVRCGISMLLANRTPQAPPL